MQKNRLQQLRNESKKKTDIIVQKGLKSIYTNQDGTLPDISHLDVRRKGRWKLILFSFIVIALILSGITWLGFIVFNPDKNFSNQSIKLDLKSQQSIASGDEVIYVLEYKNIEKVNLNNVEIIFRYPEGFEFISAEPEPNNEFKTSWQIGDLAKNASGKIEIKGKLIGEVGSIKTVNATASFQPQNFSSVFKETTSFSNQITSSILTMDLSGPSQILPEKKAIYKITYKNNSEQDLEKIKISVVYPQNFIFQEASPEPFHQADEARNLNNEWLVENLAKNQEGEIEIVGGYVADGQISSADLAVQIGFLDPETDEFSLQQEKSVTTEIIESNLNFNLIINGSNSDQPINFGQILTYSITYKNLGQKDLDNAFFTITLDADILDWDSLEDKHGGIIKGNQISWGIDQISELDLLRPLAEGSIDFSIQVKNAEDVDLDQDNLQVKSKAVASLAKIGDLAVENFEITSEEIKNNINTDIQLKVEGRYYNDDNIAVGGGPLPPVVGQKTTFRIYWSIANSLHEVADATVKTALPEGVEWADKYLLSTGDIKYDSKDRSITWSVNRIPTNKGFDDINGWFDVSVIPTAPQVRKLLVLTGQSNLTATDEDTESEITKVGKAITSNLDDDPIAGGKGLVIDITE